MKMRIPRLVLPVLFLLAAFRAFAADAPPDPATLTDAVRISIGKKLAVKFTMDRNALKNPVIVEKLGDKEAGITLDFKKDSGILMLDIHSALGKTLRCRCLARLWGKKTWFETDVVPVMAGLDDMETWQDPIEEVVLFDFKLTDEKP
ncbi:MAG TPA: hypothetical protein VG733_04430 [Chthoniobacteraceae bacterium]|nr:hypothetical protein [Chthoniobacteraceae bacterium]